MQLTKREWPAGAVLRHAGVALGSGALLGFLGPFGTYPALERPTRYAFWIGLAAFGYANAALLAWAVSRSALASRVSPVARLVGVALGSTIPTTLATAWVLSLLQPGRVFGPAAMAALFGAVAAVQFVLVLGHDRLADPASRAGVIEAVDAPPADPVTAPPGESTETRAEGSSGTGASPRTPPAPAFMKRVPPRYGSELLALESDDHYLRVHTAVGAFLMHFRMADALDQLVDADGLQVHRRWWVVRSAVTAIERDANRTFLRLRNDLRVPVSRTYLPAVRAAGWPPATSRRRDAAR